MPRSTASPAACSPLGLERGDRLGIWSPNCVEWVLVQYATAKAGVILVKINPAYRTHEVGYALAQSGCRVLVAADRRSRRATTRDGRGGPARARRLERLVFLGTATGTTFSPPATVSTPTLLAEREAREPFDDPINIQYTSGTTGFPKGATLSHHNILNNGYFVGEGCRYTEHDRVCIPVPFYHCFGMVLGQPRRARRTARRWSIPAPAFDPLGDARDGRGRALHEPLRRPDDVHRRARASGRSTEFDLSSLRTGIMAGSPCPVEVMKRCVTAMHMDEVTICYGMTETSPVSTQTGADDAIDKRVGTVGRVHPHVEVKVVDPETGRTVARGEPGELCTRGYSVMLGYWNDAEKTAEAIDARGWMHTGDLAVMDDEGYLNIVGRIKDMIIRGGENVYPREIEEFLYAPSRLVDVAGDRRARRALRRGADGVGCGCATAPTLDARSCAPSARGRSRTTRSPGTCTCRDEFR